MKAYGHFWTIPVECYFYIIVPLIMLIIIKLKSNKKAIIFLICMLTIFSVLFPYWKCPENSINIVWYIPVFIIGILTAYAYRYFKNTPKTSIFWDILVILIFIAMFCSIPQIRYILFNIEPSSYLQNKYLFFGIAWSLIIIAMQNSKYLINIFNKSKILAYIGKISFPIYLIHYVIMMRFKFSNYILKLFVIFALSILLATIMHYIIEVPIKKLLTHKKAKS